MSDKPKILKRLIHQLKSSGHDNDAAEAIALSSLIKSGNLDNNGNATAKGIRRGLMTPAQRAIDRASQRSGRPPARYKYNTKTNRATLRRKKP